MAANSESGDMGKAGGLIGSLRQALTAASRDDISRQKPLEHLPAASAADLANAAPGEKTEPLLEPSAQSSIELDGAAPALLPLPSAADAAREARAGAPNIPPVEVAADRHVEFERQPPTRIVRHSAAAQAKTESTRTQLVRGQPKVERGDFKQDPVVGWLVIIGGPGIGSYRPIFEGNNTIGRSSANRIPIDFGDETISSEEQAYIRYDSVSRTFLLVPNMAKTNIVSLNDDRPTAAVRLQSTDIIRMGRTQLVFVAFCGLEFDWSELAGLKNG